VGRLGRACTNRCHLLDVRSFSLHRDHGGSGDTAAIKRELPTQVSAAPFAIKESGRHRLPWHRRQSKGTADIAAAADCMAAAAMSATPFDTEPLCILDNERSSQTAAICDRVVRIL